MLKQKTLYSLRDICTIPCVTTSINSRRECSYLVDSIEKNSHIRLPIIAAPMSCVLSEDNYKEFHKNHLNCIIPRTTSLERRLELSKKVFCAFSLNEAKDLLNLDNTQKRYILLDMANGHMKSQLELGESLKLYFGENIILMGGNIANPVTYLEYNRAGFDYVRCGIGGGAGCLSSTMTSVHYPMASLIDEIKTIRYQYNHCNCAIVADGGIGSYSEVIKCLALGADYVMMGKVFSKAALYPEDLGKIIDYYGMSSKRAQKEMGNSILKTSEGKSEVVTKEYTLSGWTENMIDYLRSAMSYCDSRNLNEFREKAVCQVISSNSSIKINDK